MASNLQEPQTKDVDWLTTLAIAAIVISITQIIHEGLHALTCLVVGAELQEFSALHVSCANGTEVQSKIVSGSSSIVNILVAGATAFMLRRSRNRTAEFQYFLWLFMLVNGLMGTGYWLFSGVANIGDWANVIDGWTPHLLWRIVMSVLGVVSYAFIVWFSLHEFGKMIGGTEKKDQIRRATKMGLLSYVSVVFVILIAGLFNPYGITGLPAIAALLLALGGMSPMLWMMQWFQAGMFRKPPHQPFVFQRQWSWIVVAVMMIIGYSVVLGRGLVFV